LDKIRDEVIRNRAKAAPIKDKMGENRLGYFGYVKRSVDAHVRRYEMTNPPEYKRNKGWPNKGIT